MIRTRTKKNPPFRPDDICRPAERTENVGMKRRPRLGGADVDKFVVVVADDVRPVAVDDVRSVAVDDVGPVAVDDVRPVAIGDVRPITVDDV